MRDQHPGISQPIPRQQSGYDDMQLLQQHLMYNKLQELQRQQQLGQEQRQQSSLNQMSGIPRQMLGNHLPTLLNSMPLNDSAKFSWQNEFTGGQPRVPSSSQMSMVDNMNLMQHGGSPAMYGFSNGHMLSHDQGQVLQSMGFAQQQPDGSLYGMPIPNARTPSIPHSQFQQFSQDFAGVMDKANARQSEKSKDSTNFNSFQNNLNFYNEQSGHGNLASKDDMQGKQLSDNVAADNVNTDASGSFHQINPYAEASQVQEFHARQVQPEWSGNLPEREAPAHGSSQVSVGLDPTEQKILFSSDDDVNWDTSFGKSGILNMGGFHGSAMEGSDPLLGLPSLQSGTWSALMQSAVAEASGGDMGLQDEWSSLSFQKAESSDNHTAVLSDSAKQQNAMFRQNLQNSSYLPSGPAPFENGHAGSSDFRSNSSQQINDSNNHFNSNLHDKSGMWAGHSRKLPAAHSVEKTDFSPQNVHDTWSQQKNISSYTCDSQAATRRSSFSANNINSSNVGASFRIPGNESSIHHGSMGDPSRNVYSGRDGAYLQHNNGSRNSNPSIPGPESTQYGSSFPQMSSDASMDMNSLKENRELHQQGQGFYQHYSNQAKQPIHHSSLNSQGNKNTGGSHQLPYRSPPQRESSVSNSDRISGETYDRKQDHGSQRELSSESYISSHSHPDHSSDSAGGVRENFPHTGGGQSFAPGNRSHGQVDHKGPQKQAAYVQQMVARGMRVQDPRFAQQALSSNNFGVEMTQGNHAQRNANRTAEMHARENMNSHDMRASAPFDQRIGQNSQNMLELLHKVDQSGDDGDVTGVGFPDRNFVAQGDGYSVSDNLIAGPQHKQGSGFQGFGLRLAPPSGQRSKDAVERNMQMGSSVGGKAVNQYYERSQLFQQQMSGPSGLSVTGQSANTSFRASSDSYADKTCSPHHQQKFEAHDGAPLNSQQLFVGSNRIPHFNSTPADTHQPQVSQSCATNSRHPSQSMVLDSSSERNSAQQLLLPGRGLDPHSSITSGTTLQGGVSGALHNVWTNISAQRLSNNLSQKGVHNSLQSIESGKLDTVCSVPQTTEEQDQITTGNTQANPSVSNPQNLSYSEEQKNRMNLKLGKVEIPLHSGTSHDKETLAVQASGGNSVPVSSFASLHNQDRGKQAQSSNNNDLYQQIEQNSIRGAAPYSLLQQVQAMKATESNLRASKRLKVGDLGSAPQKLYGSDALIKGAAGNELNALVHRSSFPLDSKMLSFSAEGSGQQSMNKHTQVSGVEIPQDFSGSRLKDPENDHTNMVPPSYPNLPGGRNEQIRIDPRMAASWFQKYGNMRNGNIPSMHGLISAQQNSKNVMGTYIIANASKNMSAHNIVERGNDGGANESLCQSSSIPAVNEDASLPQELPSEVCDPDMVTISKKRKSMASDFLAWHREIILGSDRLLNIRMVERDWAQATNRIIEKIENEVELSDEGPVATSRRRLVLSTQLMQQLISPVPAAIISEPLATGYESVMYSVARLSLGGACNLVSNFRIGAVEKSDGENTIPAKSKASEAWTEPFLLKLVENFIGRSKKLENDLNRLEKRAPLLDVRVECQELERFSIINRFAKFHGRGHQDGVDNSSPETSRQMFGQRYVTAISMPGNIPEGVMCLSL